MEVIVAKTAGFCFGVKRAVEKVYEQIEFGKKPIYTYGPIIHNEVVVNDLDAKGVKVIDTKEELSALKEGVVVIRSFEDFEKLAISEAKQLCLVAQTTFNYNKFQELVEKISRTSYDINVLNTICNATQERQVEAKKVASQVDVMLVIGGKHSSNTQ